LTAIPACIEIGVGARWSDLLFEYAADQPQGD
jgi:hypothetical protein